MKRGITGAEIPVTLFFADVRGSTSIGESMRPADFRAYLDRFYRMGSHAILEHDGLVDKLVATRSSGCSSAASPAGTMRPPQWPPVAH